MKLLKSRDKDNGESPNRSPGSLVMGMVLVVIHYYIYIPSTYYNNSSDLAQEDVSVNFSVTLTHDRNF